MTAVTVDLPLWREQRRSFLSALDLRIRSCQGSGGIPAHSMIAAGSRRSRRLLASISEPLQRFGDGELRLREVFERRLDGDRDDGPLLRVHDTDRARVLDLGRFRPAGLTVAFTAGTEAQPAERLVLPDLDLGRETGLSPGSSEVAD